MSQIISSNVYNNTVLKKTYILLALTLLPTIAGAYMGMQIPLESYRQHPWMWLIGSLVLSLGSMFMAFKNKDNTLGVVFTFIFTGIMGFTLAPSLQHTLHLSNGPFIIMEAAFLTSFALFATAAYVSITKRDFSFMGSFLFGSLWVLIGASIIGIFFNSSIFQILISVATILIFMGYLLYDISKIIHNGEQSFVVATINIYLDLINIFSALLRILGILPNSD